MSSDDARPAGRPILPYLLTGLAIVCAAVAIPVLRAERASLIDETRALTAARPTLAATRDSLAGLRSRTAATLMLERARAATRDEPKLHLVIAVDSGTVALVRDGITLRSMPARFRGTALKRGTQAIVKIAETPVRIDAPTVDSLGNAIAALAAEMKIERVTLTDGTVLEGGDAAEAFLGGSDNAPGPRTIIVSRRDFAAVRPNLARGMKAVLF